jgi:H-type lectin domain
VVLEFGLLKRISPAAVGIEQGRALLFSHFADGGAMWRGSGEREIRQSVTFSETFSDAPTVMVGISLWDADQKTNLRADISAENITATGFDIVFRTWADSRLARVRADWIALGPVRNEDQWEVE